MIKSIQTRVIPLILVIILGVVGFFGITGKISFTVPQSYASISKQTVLIIHDSSDAGGERVYEQIVAALSYAKVTFESLDLSETMVLPTLNRYSSIAMATEFVTKLDKVEVAKVEEFVYDGGGVAVLYRCWSPYLIEMLGISSTDAPEFIETSGIRFLCDLQPGIKDEQLGDRQYLTLSAEDEPLISCLDLMPARGTEIVAVSADSQPLVWRNRYGNGRVIYWNMDWLAFKRARGLIAQTILSTQQVGAMAIANIGVFHIDDCPAPPTTTKMEPIKTEYDLAFSDFYHQVWYPDMVSLSRKFDIVYTCLVIFNYNDTIELPFGFAEWEHAKIRINDQDMPLTVHTAYQIAQRYELGLHGYNHISLMLEGWGSQKNMVEALLAGKKRWEENSLDKLPFTYVPPHNMYDVAGIKAVAEAFPSIKVIGGIYLGAFEEGGFREFGPDPWEERIFDMPRMSEGYFLHPSERLLILGGLNMFGVFTHFIHPDDVLDNPVNYPREPEKKDIEYATFDYRNPHTLPWRGDYDGEKDGFYYNLEEIFDYVRRNYPWLRHMSTEDAYYEFQRYFATDLSFSFEPHEMTVTLSDTPAYFQVRTNDGRRIDLSEITNCQFIHVYEGEGYDSYTFKALEKEVPLKFIMPV
ncbi:MAG: DUF2194 domain-containing protein [Chloroflexota bacterium]|nr:DUF2194 domain-containing protein [Chloroflexota bacterium]